MKLGLEVLLEEHPAYLSKARFGLLSNQASVDSRLRSAHVLLHEQYPDTLQCLFSPQHGFRGEKQDNMIESPTYHDLRTGLKVHSLYGEERSPSRSMLNEIDFVVIDLQDVGTRVYTFIYTMALCLEACKALGKRVVVLDRPNPIGGRWVQGNVLEADWTSFVGMFPIPMRHGMTIGELALLFNSRFGIGADLTVVPLRGWLRHWNHPQTGRVFVPPSPNMPCYETALVYPGQVIWEGTNISEGRGTTRPFEVFGAPFLRTVELEKQFRGREIPGVFLREISFEPTFHKWAGRLCHGFHLHITEPEAADPFFVSLCLLQDVIELHPEDFQWKSPPYEYETERMPIHLILGSRSLREKAESGGDLEEEKRRWEEAAERFNADRRVALLYP